MDKMLTIMTHCTMTERRMMFSTMFTGESNRKMSHSLIFFCNSEYCYAIIFVMLSIVILRIVMLNVVRLILTIPRVILLSVVIL